MTAMIEPGRRVGETHRWASATIGGLHPPYQTPECSCRMPFDRRSTLPTGPPGRAGGWCARRSSCWSSLSLCVILVRTFSAEAYVVPTGSMAPTLLGWHRELVCPNCEFVFVVGIDEEGHTGQAVCPNCGEGNLDRVPAVECGGDRVLVQKFLYDFRRPKRWEVAVFHYPGRPVAGLREAGGRACRASRSGSSTATSTSTAGSSARPWTTSGRCGSWSTTAATSPRTPAGSRAGSSGRAGGIVRGPPAGRGPIEGFVHQARPDAGPGDWVIYRHWDPARRRYGPVRDFYAYNGGELPADNEVVDLGLEARLTVGPTRSRRSRRPCGPGRTSSWCGSRSAWRARSSWCTTASRVA